MGHVATPSGTGATMEFVEGSQAVEKPLSNLGPYRVLEILGRGGFGIVYRAEDTRSGQVVAIKVPREEKFVSSTRYSEFVEAIRAEALRVMRLDHPGIVKVFEVARDETSGHWYIVMELVDGGSLSKSLKTESFSPLAVANLVRQIAEALHYAHLQGLVHRDIKPSNILLTSKGRPKIVDFGLALYEDEQSAHAGQVAGTLPYMSPEQVVGKVHHLDGRTDIWSLGVITYQLLAKRLPFRGDHRQLREAIVEQPFRPLSQRNLKIPAVFDRILERCLAKEMAGRFATAGALARELRRVSRRANLITYVAVGLGATGTRCRNCAIYPSQAGDAD